MTTIEMNLLLNQTRSHCGVLRHNAEGAGGLLAIGVRPEDDRVVVALVGELDIATAPQLKSTIRGLLRVGLKHIVVNLDGVSFVDAAGIGALISTTSDVVRADGTLRLTHHPRLMMLLKLTGESRLVDVTRASAHLSTGAR